MTRMMARQACRKAVIKAMSFCAWDKLIGSLLADEEGDEEEEEEEEEEEDAAVGGGGGALPPPHLEEK